MRDTTDNETQRSLVLEYRLLLVQIRVLRDNFVASGGAGKLIYLEYVDKPHDFDRIAPGIEAVCLYRIVHGSYRLWGRVYPICRVEVIVYPRDRRNNSGNRDRSEVKIS